MIPGYVLRAFRSPAFIGILALPIALFIRAIYLPVITWKCGRWAKKHNMTVPRNDVSVMEIASCIGWLWSH